MEEEEEEGPQTSETSRWWSGPIWRGIIPLAPPSGIINATGPPPSAVASPYGHIHQGDDPLAGDPTDSCRFTPTSFPLTFVHIHLSCKTLNPGIIFRKISSIVDSDV